MINHTKQVNRGSLGTEQENLTHPINNASQSGMHNMDVLVGYILLIGVLLSGLLIIVGTGWNWVTYHTLSTQFTISNENYFGFLVSSFEQLFNGSLQPRLFISLGIVTLMLTPYIRVAASAVYFAFVVRNLKYTLFTLFVFTILTYSLFLK
jgi:uncharacterized membrane protein